jgi:DNA-binding SARP family transcriptional activator
MIELRTLGSVGLQGGEGGDPASVLRQPKRLALLVYLAAGKPRGFHRRDTLLGLFWPELNETRARNALGQALHGLRGALGSGVVVSRGSGEVELSRQRFWCDTAGFQEALQAGDRERAMELYRGDLLEGFHLADAPEFERWLEQERTRLRGAAADAAAWLADDEAAVDHVRPAIEWARRAASLSPYDERALCRLVALLDRAGDRAQAVAVYEQFTRRLAEELEVEPSPETQALIAEVRSRRQPLFGAREEDPTGFPPPARELPHAAGGPEGAAPPDHAPSSPGQPRQTPRPRLHPAGPVLVIGAAMAVLALAVLAWFPRDRHARITIDPNVVVIAPFRIAAEGPFDYLREGLIDLLATGLNGESGSRAVDPRSTMAGWRRAVGRGPDDLTPADAQRVARGLGAGQVLMGSVVGGPGRLTVNATLYDAVRSAVRVHITAHGPADSLPDLVDTVVKQLVAREAGVPRHQLAALTTTSLPALRAFIEGLRDSRSGRYSEAVMHLEHALSHDSTFALAALHLWLVAGRGQLTAEPGTGGRALRLAHVGRERLSPPDRLLLDAIAGPRYPEPTPRHELLAARTLALNASPDRPEALALMGAFHLSGVVRGEVAAHARALEYFGRALDLDSTFAVAAHTLALAAATAGDNAAVHRIVRRYLAADSISETAHLLAWLRAVTGGADVPVLEVRDRMPAMHPTALGWIVSHALLLGVDLNGAEAALNALQHNARSELERRNHAGRRQEYLGNQGRLHELRTELEGAARNVEALGPIRGIGVSAESRARGQHATQVIRTAIFWGGDTTGLGEATAVMEDGYRRTPAAGGTLFERQVVAESACFAGMARIAGDDTEHARAAVIRLHDLIDGPLELPNRASHASCAATLAALVAAAERRPDARTLAERADSLLRADPPIRIVANRMQLLLARAFDALGDPEAALRVIRRRDPSNPAFFLATLLREEGRLAARAGDHAGAIHAYTHYLALRTKPDAELMPEVQQVRHELAEVRLQHGTAR